MSSFNNNLLVEFLGNTDDVEVRRLVRYYSERVFPGLVTSLAPGFISDLDSIPEWVKSIARASQNRFKICYAMHDAWYRLWYYYEVLYPNLMPPVEHELYDEIPYKMGDLLLDESLEVKGMPRYTRGKVYYGLRLFGSPGSDDVNKDRIKLEESIQFIKLEKYETIERAKLAC